MQDKSNIQLKTQTSEETEAHFLFITVTVYEAQRDKLESIWTDYCFKTDFICAFEKSLVLVLSLMLITSEFNSTCIWNENLSQFIK